MIDLPWDVQGDARLGELASALQACQQDLHVVDRVLGELRKWQLRQANRAIADIHSHMSLLWAPFADGEVRAAMEAIDATALGDADLDAVEARLADAIHQQQQRLAHREQLRRLQALQEELFWDERDHDVFDELTLDRRIRECEQRLAVLAKCRDRLLRDALQQ